MQINQKTLADLYIGYNTLFVAAIHGADPCYPQIAMKTTSTNATEAYTWLGAMPGMKKLVGEVVIENLTASRYTIDNEEWESTVAVKKADVQRDSHGIYSPVMTALGMAAAQHPDELLGELMSGGFVNKDYTGKAFYAAEKPHEPENKKSTKFTNLVTGPLTPENYSKAKAMLKGLKNAKGRSMKLGKNMMLVVPPTLEDTAREILQAERTDGGKTNIQKGTADLLLFSDLETDTEWHLMDCSQAVKPFIVQSEVEPELHSNTNEANDHVFKKKEFLYQAYARGNAGYGLPQLAVGSKGTS